jgi:hypothetical protein
MRTVVGLATVLLCCGSLCAQYRANVFGSSNVITGSVPGVVFPGGAPGAHIGAPRTLNFNGTTARRSITGSYVYAYPVYVGSYGSVYDASSYGYGTGAPQTSQQPNITIIMPPQQAPVAASPYDAPARPQMTVVEPAPAAQSEDSTPEPTRYLLAFKDHTIYSAIAYWVDGDTLHYFTSGNTHNQVSVSLIDRAMTERLNKDAGVDVKLPK